MFSMLISRSYRWQGIDTAGHHCEGSLTIANKNALQQTLLLKKITLTQSRLRITLKKRLLTDKQRHHFITQLTQLLTAGLPLLESLRLIQKSSVNSEVGNACQQTISAIEQGATFSDALASTLCTPLINTLTQAAESAGTLPKTLAQLERLLAQAITLKATVKQALFYPTCVATIATLITIFLLVTIVPQFESLFKENGATLPLITQTVINLSSALSNHPLIIGLGLTGIGVGVAKGTPHITDHLPIIKHLKHHSECALWCDVLAQLHTAGIPLNTAIVHANNTLTGKRRGSLQNINHHLNQGVSLSNALNPCNFFTDTDKQLIHIGEESGQLSTMLTHIVHAHRDALNQQLSRLCKLIEPVMMLLLAVIIGGILLAVYLPIVTLGSLL